MSDIKAATYYKLVAQSIEFVGQQLAKTDLLTNGDFIVIQESGDIGERQSVAIEIHFDVPFSNFQNQSKEKNNVNNQPEIKSYQ